MNSPLMVLRFSQIRGLTIDYFSLFSDQGELMSRELQSLLSSLLSSSLPLSSLSLIPGRRCWTLYVGMSPLSLLCYLFTFSLKIAWFTIMTAMWLTRWLLA
jgi:hypothetical protein